MNIEAKKYLTRATYAVLALIILGITGRYLVLPLTKFTHVIQFLLLLPFIYGLEIVLTFIIMSQISYALYYGFKPSTDKLSPFVGSIVNIFLTIGVWVIIWVLLDYYRFNYLDLITIKSFN